MTANDTVARSAALTSSPPAYVTFLSSAMREEKAGLRGLPAVAGGTAARELCGRAVSLAYVSFLSSANAEGGGRYMGGQRLPMALLLV